MSTEMCRALGHTFPDVPSDPAERVLFIGEGRTDRCDRCKVTRICHPSGTRRYSYVGDDYTTFNQSLCT